MMKVRIFKISLEFLILKDIVDLRKKVKSVFGQTLGLTLISVDGVLGTNQNLFAQLMEHMICSVVVL